MLGIEEVGTIVVSLERNDRRVAADVLKPLHTMYIVICVQHQPPSRSPLPQHPCNVPSALHCLAEESVVDVESCACQLRVLERLAARACAVRGFGSRVVSCDSGTARLCRDIALAACNAAGLLQGRCSLASYGHAAPRDGYTHTQQPGANCCVCVYRIHTHTATRGKLLCVCVYASRGPARDGYKHTGANSQKFKAEHKLEAGRQKSGKEATCMTRASGRSV